MDMMDTIRIVVSPIWMVLDDLGGFRLYDD